MGTAFLARKLNILCSHFFLQSSNIRLLNSGRTSTAVFWVHLGGAGFLEELWRVMAPKDMQIEQIDRPPKRLQEVYL